jgi:hypothetical protein
MAGLESSRWNTSSQRGIFASTQVYLLLENCFGDPCANGFKPLVVTAAPFYVYGCFLLHPTTQWLSFSAEFRVKTG